MKLMLFTEEKLGQSLFPQVRKENIKFKWNMNEFEDKRDFHLVSAFF